MKQQPHRKRKVWRLDLIMGFSMLLIMLVLGASALYIGVLLDNANEVNGQTRIQASLLHEKSIEVIEKQLPLEAELYQLAQIAKEFQLEFELLTLNPQRNEQRMSHLNLGLQASLNKLQPMLQWLPPGLVGKLTQNINVLISIGDKLFATSSSSDRVQLYLQSQNPISQVIDTIQKILLLQNIQADALKMQLLDFNDDIVHGFNEHRGLFKKISVSLYLTLAAGLVLAFFAQLSFFRVLRKRLQQLENYAVDIAQERFSMPPFSSRDRVGMLALRMALMGRSIGKLIKDKEKAAKETAQLTFYDSLTGLENRTLFSKRLEQAFKSAQRYPEESKALLYLDLDDFKNINDTLGHQLGDQLLKQVTLRLQANLRQDDSLARMGGDEFAMLLHHGGKMSEILAQRIQHSLSEPFVIEGNELVCSASIGIAIIGVDAQSAGDLMKNADLALNNAKEQGKNNYQFFSSELNQRAHKRMYLLGEMRKAIKDEHFELYYQPKIDNRTQKIKGLEALIRWPHPVNGFIYPDQFIPQAEESGLIVPIGDWVVREACRQAKRLDNEGYPLPIAVNISGRQFHDIDLVKLIETVLSDSSLSPHLLEIEITESMLINDMNKSIQILENIRSLGVSIAIDDFGTGFSSLNYLKQLPLDVLKIDRSFVNNVVTDKKDETIVQTIIDLAHRLELRVVAEGIENHAQFDHLTLQGCDLAQGYLFSKPLPLDQLNIPQIYDLAINPA